MKTQNEILTDVYRIIQNSPINALSGGIYKQTRPTDSELEDCVFHLIPGVKAKFVYDGALYVKLFYPDAVVNNTYTEDLANGQTKEQLLLDLSDTLINTQGNFYQIQSRETYTEAVDDKKVHQHYAILKMNYKYTT